MYKRHELGKDGEEIAANYIIKRGFEIIERNFKCKLGEIDIIAIDGDEIVFIEVKTRSQINFGKPSDAVDKRKKKHIYNTASFYLMKNNMENAFCRMDVIEIIFKDKDFKINYIKNAILEKPKKEYFENEFYEEEDYDN